MHGKRIIHLRNQRGWTQAQLAKKLGVSSKTIKNWETDVSDPSASNIIALTRLFFVSSDFILGITSTSYLNIDSASPADQKRLRAIFQAYFNTTDDDSTNE